MTNNDVLRGVRYALALSATAMTEIFSLAGQTLAQARIINLLKKEEEEGFVTCPDALMEDFLRGLIIYRRGRQEGKPEHPPPSVGPLSNNSILKKLRIALVLQEGDMLAILQQAGNPVSKAELSALFRKAGHKNYKECGDQFLRNFLKGLALRYREAAAR
ncbi:MAG: hypothetical protein A2505_00240 [Deltaproteobacteria bacterium RIFOXYD12_FULL_55_16]|nr:MAG: hypothetical protein A2505_00240 [Deltaproteobacteria bacterium RIFOXYD12_FULL_55_16]